MGPPPVAGGPPGAPRRGAPHGPPPLTYYGRLPVPPPNRPRPNVGFFAPQATAPSRPTTPPPTDHPPGGRQGAQKGGQAKPARRRQPRRAPPCPPPRSAPPSPRPAGRGADGGERGEEGRPAWKLRPTQMLIALGLVLTVALLGIALLLTGPIVNSVAKPLGIGSTATSIWSLAKWPAMLLLGLFLVGVLLLHDPERAPARLSVGDARSILAVVLWLAASALFALYAANFGSYDKTYGTLGGVVVLLIWMWITNIALLLGQELNAECERRVQVAEGLPKESPSR